MQLRGRVALVTGASRGIGRATALELARRGADVVVVARDLESRHRLAGSLAATAEAIEALGVDVLPLACDLSDRDALPGLCEAAWRWKQRVDVLVNNAAFLGRASFHSLDELTAATWQRQVDVNVTAPLLLSKALVPHMRAAGGGVIVNITSDAAELREGDVPGIAYGTTKAALNRLTLGLARDLRPDGIAVLAVDPGYVRTEVAERAAEHEGWDIDIERAHPPEVAAAAIADLVERDESVVSGRVWSVGPDREPTLRHDGRA